MHTHFFDYTAAATGMTYKSEIDQRGARIDGVPESPTTGQIGWETVDGPQGSLGIVHTYNTDIPSLSTTSYYLDKQAPAGAAETQCTGDGSAYGASGPRIAQSIPNTDPTLGTANRLTVTRSLFFDSPGKTDGPRQKAQVTSPLQLSFANWP